MSDVKVNFEELIVNHQKEANSNEVIFLSDFLNLLREDKNHARLAHASVYEAITQDGYEEIDVENNSKNHRIFGNKKLKRYNYFKDFFGIEEPIHDIVKYFYSAANRGEQSRQVLYLMGPVGAGKSSLSEALKKAMQNLPPFWALDGPMQQNPLLLIPENLRPQIEDELGIKIEGDLNPVNLAKLEKEYDGDINKFPIIKKSFSKIKRVGIAEIPPVDQNNQDTAILIGIEDIHKLHNHSEDDPMVLSLSGAFNVGNRGIVEWIEVFKNQPEYLHTMITATQEKQVPAPGRHGAVYVDTAIIAHSNESEWRKFKADHNNEAILDRIVTVKVPYNLRLDEEVKIYKKMIEKSNFSVHIAPNTIEYASKLAILSRLNGTNTCDPISKMKLYNGEVVSQESSVNNIDVEQLREESEKEENKEGMSGISPRFIMKALNNAMTDSQEGITPLEFREAVKWMIKKEDTYSEKQKEKYLSIIDDILYKDYLEVIEKEITKAFVYEFSDSCDTMFDKYLDHAEAFVKKSKVHDENTGENLEPDESFMNSIEEQIGIVGTASDEFRTEVQAKLFEFARKGEKLTYESYEPLKRAIEGKVSSSVKDISRIITMSNARSEDQRNKYRNMIDALEDIGYNEYTAKKIVQHASNNLWKD